ncbi:hypothetical protein MMC17_000763 [Xylographa soralifera]|nr:hypothetical protein [Xylographa soralifera]
MDQNRLDELLRSVLKVHEAEDQLIIGLDFGTTFSGVAYAFPNSNELDLVSILDWPGMLKSTARVRVIIQRIHFKGLEGHKQPKVPTVISHDRKDRSTFTWGAQKHKNEKIEGIKLLLDTEQETPIYLPASNTAAELKRLGKPAVEVAADYISAIYKHAMGRIESKMPADYLQMCQKKFFLSVPAVWSDKAKDTTLKAAKQAGIHPVTLIKEPEAAALYTLRVLQDKALAIGDAFVLCDAGGGTVDLISYEITALLPHLELKELVPGKCLNRRFEQAVKDVVGEDQFYHLRKSKGFEEAMLQFDRTIKTAFRGAADEEWYVNFPMANLQDDQANNIQANCWNVKGYTKTDILRLVDDQVNLVTVKRMTENHPKAKEIKAIFLVGGFGSSEYLKQCLEAAHANIQIIQPHDAWSAIVKGAVLSQLPQEASITSSVATRHYGVAALSSYNEAEDSGQPKKRDDNTGIDRVLKMTWYIYQGEDLKRDQKLTFPFYHSLEENFPPKALIFTDELIQCEAVQPAKYPKQGVTNVNCVLTSDLTGVDRSHFKTKTSTRGAIYYDVYYNLAVTIEAAVMKFSLEINGKEIGSVTAAYE